MQRKVEREEGNVAVLALVALRDLELGGKAGASGELPRLDWAELVELD